jgi:predicted Zn-dependent protease
MVDPQTVLVTASPATALFMIEDGKLTFPVKNFRFNESPVIMLNNLDALGKADPLLRRPTALAAAPRCCRRMRIRVLHVFFSAASRRV